MNLKNKILIFKKNIFSVCSDSLRSLNRDFCEDCPFSREDRLNITNLNLRAEQRAFVLEQFEINYCDLCGGAFDEAGEYLALKVISEFYNGYIAVTKHSIETKMDVY